MVGADRRSAAPSSLVWVKRTLPKPSNAVSVCVGLGMGLPVIWKATRTEAILPLRGSVGWGTESATMYTHLSLPPVTSIR